MQVRWVQILSLAYRDLTHGWATTLCFSVAVAAALLPLLILFGLKYGVVNNLIDTLRNDPNVREIRLVRDTELSLSWFETIGARSDVRFLLPKGNFLASSVRMRAPDGRRLLDTRVVPTAANDPLISGLEVPTGAGQILLTERVAIEGEIEVGDDVELIIQRTVGEVREAVRHTLRVTGIVPRDRLQTDDIFVAPMLEDAIETWRQGFAVVGLDWPARDGSSTLVRPERESFSSFRLYANDVRDVPELRDVLLRDGLDVRTRAEEVIRVLLIERALSLVFFAITVLGAAGFLLTLGLHLVASVADKARELAILRLLGLTSAEVSLMPSIQGMAIAGCGAVLACSFAALSQPVVNTLFSGLGGLEGRVSFLAPSHFALAIIVTVLAGGAAGSIAGLRAATIEPRRGLRHD
jgi:putative ABC transport system permease protein